MSNKSVIIKIEAQDFIAKTNYIAEVEGIPRDELLHIWLKQSLAHWERYVYPARL